MAGAAKKAPEKMNISISDADIADMVKTVLAFESGIRGRSLGQTAYEMVMESADVDNYPPELKECLDEMARENDRVALEKSLRIASSG